MQETTILEAVALATTIRQIPSDRAPLWGRFNTQQMIEHLIRTIRYSNGKEQSVLYTPEDKLPLYREFLYSDRPLRRNITAPFMPGEPPALVYEDLEEAQAQLLAEVADFHTYYDSHPDDHPVHPSFGPLNYREWCMFHQKHFKHHFEQFGM